jgi:hypothetical protein
MQSDETESVPEDYVPDEWDAKQAEGEVFEYMSRPHTRWARSFSQLAGSKNGRLCVFPSINECSYVELTSCAQQILIIRFGLEASILKFSLADFKQIFTGKYARRPRIT